MTILYPAMQLTSVHFPHSIKNITISTQASYKKKLVAKTGQFINRLRWHVLFRYVYDKKTGNDRETYGFKSMNRAPEVECLKSFDRIKTFSFARYV